MAASIHIRLNADLDVVPEQRWLYLGKSVILQHLLDNGLATWGSLPIMAQRLKANGIRYSQVLHADHLRAMLSREGLSTAGERPLLEQRLASNLPKSPAELEAAAAAAAPKAAGTPASKAAKAAANPSPKQWKKELNTLAEQLGEQGKKMTKEMCAAQLTQWGRLKEGHTVFHIISPVKGGVDHPSNYCILPNYFPADYHLGEAKAKMHHILVCELLSDPDIKRALAISLGEEQKEEQLSVLKAMVHKFKEDAASCGSTKNTNSKNTKKTPGQANSGAAQANGGAAQDGSEAGPSGAAQGGSQAEPSTDARSSKRARTEEGGEAAGGSADPKGKARCSLS